MHICSIWDNCVSSQEQLFSSDSVSRQKKRENVNEKLILKISVEACVFHFNFFGRANCIATPEFRGWDACSSNREKYLRRGIEFGETVIQSTNIGKSHVTANDPKYMESTKPL